MEEHQLERSVTERYLLCLLDKSQMDFTDSIGTIIDQRIDIVQRLVENGLSKQSDLKLLVIEREANAELYTASCQSYHTHLMGLNLLFVNGGIQVGDFAGWYRHFGWSAGLAFSWTIFDGRQKRRKEHQAEWQRNSIRTYKENSEYQRNMRIKQCLSEWNRYDERERTLENQLAEYEYLIVAIVPS